MTEIASPPNPLARTQPPDDGDNSAERAGGGGDQRHQLLLVVVAHAIADHAGYAGAGRDEPTPDAA